MNPEKMQKFVEIMKRLRAPDGCPWDREQTHASLKKCTMEECAELMDAIENNDDAGMCEELGDMLMHVVLHACIAEERKVFSFDDVVDGISEKMIRRHPHVFGEEHVESSHDVLAIWDRVKKKEHAHDRKSVLDGIPNHFPALLQAEKMQKKAAKTGFDWTRQEDILLKIREELAEVESAVQEKNDAHTEEEIGDLLFAVVNLARFRHGKSAEELLADANRKFSRRFRYIESRLQEQGRTLEQSTPEEMNQYWDEAKSNE